MQQASKQYDERSKVYLAEKDTNGSSAKGVEQEKEKEGRVNCEEDVAEGDEVDGGAEESEGERQGCRSEGAQVVNNALIRIVDHGLGLNLVEGLVFQIALEVVFGHPRPPSQ